MKILLVYPETPTTFWSFHHALKFVSKKASEPPLGLITIAGMLPESWDVRMIDMNVSQLKDKSILWADYVFLSGMSVHIESFKHIIRRCNELNVKVVAGGPMATIDHAQFLGVDHFVLGEAEATLPLFIRDLEAGHPEKMYTMDDFPEMAETPIPRWDLLDMKKYHAMPIQFSRGCPFNCEFCSVTLLNGHRPRAKRTEQFIEELDQLHKLGWRGSITIVDDNLIGNKKSLKALLPAMIDWQKAHKYPFSFATEASINVADDSELVRQLVSAGLKAVFIGIETPSEASLTECAKNQNLKRDLVSSIHSLQHEGLIVYGGFIVGFDNDPQTIFEDQIQFIQKSGITTAMVGLLTALSGTHLFKRLKSENRLLNLSTGNNMDGSLNFIPKMQYQKLIAGYKSVLTSLYSSKEYYDRVRTFLENYKITTENRGKLTWTDIGAFFRSVWVLGVLEKGRKHYWKLLGFTLRDCPEKFAMAVTMAIYGFHFRKVIQTV